MASRGTGPSRSDTLGLRPELRAATRSPLTPVRAADAGLLGVLALLWGSGFVFIREGLVGGASPLLFAFARYGLAALAFVLLAVLRREPLPARHEVVVSATLGGVFVVGLYGVFLFWGEQFTTGGYSTLLSSATPILTVTLAFVLLPSERPAARAWFGVLLGFVGIVALAAPGVGAGDVGVSPGPELVLGAFVSIALGTVMLRRFGRGPQGFWQLGTMFGVGGLLAGSAAVLLPAPERLPLTVGVVPYLVALVLLSSVAQYGVYFAVHHRLGPVRANLVTYLVPLVGVGLGSGVYGEPLDLYELVGVLVVLAGVTLVVSSGSPRSRAS